MEEVQSSKIFRTLTAMPNPRRDPTFLPQRKLFAALFFAKVFCFAKAEAATGAERRREWDPTPAQSSPSRLLTPADILRRKTAYGSSRDFFWSFIPTKKPLCFHKSRLQLRPSLCYFAELTVFLYRIVAVQKGIELFCRWRRFCFRAVATGTVLPLQLLLLLFAPASSVIVVVAAAAAAVFFCCCCDNKQEFFYIYGCSFYSLFLPPAGAARRNEPSLLLIAIQ